MAKDCEDCGRVNFDSAVTCAECGSLFPEMVGRLLPVEGDVEGAGDDAGVESAVAAAHTAAAHATDPAAQRVVSYARCADCTLIMESGPARCKRCGSRRLEAVSEQETRTAAMKWAARHRERFARYASVEAEFPTVGLEEVLALAGLAVVKLLFEIPLGVAILFSQAGPGGVSATTFAWKYPLGISLVISAGCGMFGAYGLFYLERFGPILLSVAFALDALLVLWIVVFISIGTIDLWPGLGPYFFLLLVSSVLAVYSGRLATGNRLGSA